MPLNSFCSHSASVAKACFLTCLFAAGILFDSSSSSAAPLNYTVNGGTSVISGTVGSLAFTDATWVVTATADPATVLSATGAYFIPATVTLSITDSVNGTTPMTLSDFSGATWGVYSGDLSAFMAAGTGFAGFTALNTSTQPWTQPAGVSGFYGFLYFTGGIYGGTPGIYTDLGTPGTWLGGAASPPETSDYVETSLGEMNLSAGSAEFTGSFTISAVPEPSTYAMALAGLACGGYSLFRRRKRA